MADKQIKWYQDGTGSVSMMRISAMVAVITGALMILFSLSIAVAMLVTDKYALMPLITVIITTASGMITLTLGAKAWQTKIEHTPGTGMGG